MYIYICMYKHMFVFCRANGNAYIRFTRLTTGELFSWITTVFLKR